MDPIAKQNLLVFLTAMAVVAAFWLLVLGIGESDPWKILGGIAAAAAAVVTGRLYLASRQG